MIEVIIEKNIEIKITIVYSVTQGTMVSSIKKKYHFKKELQVYEKDDGIPSKDATCFYTVAEVADILRVTTRTVHTYLHVDGLPYKKVGKYNLIANEDLSRWINKQAGMTLTEWQKNVSQ